MLPFVKEGKIRGIAVTCAQRTAIMPAMPTISEAGLPGYELVNWYAIVVPAATPGAIVTRLNREIQKALAVAEVKRRFLELAADPQGSTPEQLAAYTRDELAKWSRVIKAAGIKPE